MEVLLPWDEQHKDRESLQLQVISEISSASMPPTTISTFVIWETTSEVGSFCSHDDPRRISLTTRPSSPAPTRRWKRNLSTELSFPKRGGVSQEICEACGQALPEGKNIPGTSRE